MARAALIDDNGTVVNVIVTDPDADYDPGAGLTLHVLPDDSPVTLGSTYDGTD